MKPAQSERRSGQRMIVLNKTTLNAQSLKSGLGVGFGEPAASIAMPARLDQADGGSTLIHLTPLAALRRSTKQKLVGDLMPSLLRMPDNDPAGHELDIAFSSWRFGTVKSESPYVGICIRHRSGFSSSVQLSACQPAMRETWHAALSPRTGGWEAREEREARRLLVPHDRDTLHLEPDVGLHFTLFSANAVMNNGCKAAKPQHPRGCKGSWQAVISPLRRSAIDSPADPPEHVLIKQTMVATRPQRLHEPSKADDPQADACDNQPNDGFGFKASIDITGRSINGHAAQQHPSRQGW